MKNLALNVSLIAIFATTCSLAATASEANSKPTVTSSSLTPATNHKPAYGDNPSLARVLLYKTGQGIQNVGDAIQRSSENTANAIKQRLNPEQQPQNTTVSDSSATPQNLTEQTPQPADSVQPKTIIQGRLSQSTSSTAAAGELNQAAPATGGAKTFAIGTE